MNQSKQRRNRSRFPSRHFSAFVIGTCFCLMLDARSFAEVPQWSKFQNGGQFEGPDQMPTEWSPERNISWTADIPGYGQSSPIISDNQIVVTSTSGDNKDDYHVISYALDSGKKNWQIDVKNPTPYKNSPMVSRAAPSALTTKGGYVAFFEGGSLIGISNSGEKQWERDLVQEYGPIEARHGLASSLESDGNRVFVWVERSEDPYVLAIDPTSGETLWKSAGVGATSWGSPRMVPVDGGSHLVCSAIGKIIGLDPETGDRLWEFDGISNNSSNTPTPVRPGQFLIGASEGRGQSSSGNAAASNGLIQLTQQEDGTWEAAFQWKAEKATSSFGSPVVAGETVAIVNRAGVLYRLDLETGKQLSVNRTKAGGVWATPIVVGENIFLFGYKGITSVISLEDNQEIAENRCWTDENAEGENPAFAGGSVLYAAAVAGNQWIIRSGDKLYSIQNE